MKRESIELLLDWLAAVRGNDRDGATARLSADVEWRGTGDELLCQGADEVVQSFRAARDGLGDIEAIELIGQDSSAVLRAHASDRGDIYDVFRFDDGQIVRIEDYATREQALAAAGSGAAA
jgi:ketosteroid isomerase-like protein